MLPLYNEGSLGASGLAINSLALSVPARVDDAVVASMVNKIKGISNHTYNLIRNQIKEGVSAGESVAEMSNRVIDVYKFNSARARIIAQTESANVMNRTTDSEYKKAQVSKKVWIATNDKATRDSHRKVNNEEVEYNKPFSNGLMFPGDPNGPGAEVINCRCAFAAIK
jgi:SPP1 gp7 family putative phage head morphogenesis protein